MFENQNYGAEKNLYNPYASAKGGGLGALQASQQQANVPKELGLLQRVDGVLNGLEEIRGRLTNLAGRVHGEPQQPPETTANRIADPGLPTKLTMIENEIRACINMLVHLNDSF